MTKSVLFAGVLGLCLVSLPASSQQQSYDQAVAYCKALGEMASTIMDNRQKGVPKGEQMASMEALENEHWRQLGAKIATSAYERTGYTDEVSQKRDTEDFLNEFEPACYRMYLD